MGIMSQDFATLQYFSEYNMLYLYFHKAFFSLVYTILHNTVFQILPHFFHIQHFSLCEHLQFLIVNMCTVHVNYFSFVQC